VTDDAPGFPDDLARVFLEFTSEAACIMRPDGDPADQYLLLRRAADFQDVLDEQNGLPRSRARRWLKERGIRGGLRRANAELKAVDAAWRHRYDTRHASAREHRIADTVIDVLLPQLGPGLPLAGIDGARYAPTRPGSPEPVVFTMTDARVAEILTGFRDEEHRMAWLADREHGRACPEDGRPSPVIPLAGGVPGPESLALAEERVLAWMLRAPAASREPVSGLEGHDFSCHSRAEIFEAWRSAAAKDPSPSPGDCPPRAGPPPAPRPAVGRAQCRLAVRPHRPGLLRPPRRHPLHQRASRSRPRHTPPRARGPGRLTGVQAASRLKRFGYPRG